MGLAWVVQESGFADRLGFQHSVFAGDRRTEDWVSGMGARNGPSRRQYEICVRGHLGETMRVAFPAMQAQRRGKDTVLTGALPDQSAPAACSPRSRPSGWS